MNVSPGLEKPSGLASRLSRGSRDFLRCRRAVPDTPPAPGTVQRLHSPETGGRRATYLVTGDQDRIVNHGAVPQVGGVAQGVRPVGTEGPEAGR